MSEAATRRASARARATIACASFASGIACGANDPGTHETADAEPDFVTEHAQIHFDSKYRLCAGTLRKIDEQLERRAMQLELPIEAPVEITLGLRAVEANCHLLARGCSHADGRVFTSITAMWHELTHALRIHNDRFGPSMFEEGLAEFAVAGEGFIVMVGASEYPLATLDGPSTLLPIPRPEFEAGDYGPATHIVTWMSETFGASALQRYLNTPAFEPGRSWSEAAEQLEASFGLDLATLEARWRAEAQPQYRLGTSCGPADHHPFVDGLEIHGRIDCDDLDTEGPSEDLEQTALDVWSRASCMDVAEATRARVTYEADHGRLYVVAHNVDCPEGGYHELAAGESLELDLLACEWVFGPYASSMAPTEYTIRVDSLGPIK